MTNIFITISSLLLLSFAAFAQEKYYTKTGHIYFMSHTSAIDIDGTNKQTVSFLDINTGELGFAVLIKGFEFTLATAAEHFNETYMESHKFPKASFKGKIIDISKVDFKKPSIYNVIAEGDLTIHGITKKVKEPASIEVKDGGLLGKCDFKVNINDYGITVPKVVEERVAKVVDIKVNCEYLPYKK